MTPTDAQSRCIPAETAPVDDGPARWRELGAGALVFVVVAGTLCAMALGARHALREHVTLTAGSEREVVVRFHQRPRLPRQTTGARLQPLPVDSSGPLRVALVRADAVRGDTLLTWLAAYRDSRDGVRIAVRETGIEDGTGYARVLLAADAGAAARTYRIALRAWYMGYAPMGSGPYTEPMACPGCVARVHAPRLFVTVRKP